MTAKQGFQGNLSPGEIVGQYAALPERKMVTNFVYMGMGEPLDNLDSVLKSLEILTADWGYGVPSQKNHCIDHRAKKRRPRIPKSIGMPPGS
jgi:adenine C2-methylase RlmN of 23S rRNA A2503 and tRNA A37